MFNKGEEFARRTGHRFNVIIKSLPTDQPSAMLAGALFEKLQKFGYKERLDQLNTDLYALIERKEIGSSSVEGKTTYWVLPHGLFETRKRSALIKLHNMDISEEELKSLERIARIGSPKE